MSINGETTLEWLSSRRSVRQFKPDKISKEVLTRLIRASTTAPSSSNRQPWRFSVVTCPAIKEKITEAVRRRTDEIKTVIQAGHHAEDYANYGDFFHEPLQGAAALIIPQYRVMPDLIANLIESGGGDPEQYHTASTMQAELCSTSASIMALLLQAHSEGLGACWMAGPMVAVSDICEILKINKPWQMVGAVALGYPVSQPEAKPRKPLERVVQWFTPTTEERAEV